MFIAQILLNQYIILFKRNFQFSILKKSKFLLSNVTQKTPSKANQTKPNFAPADILRQASYKHKH